MNVYGKKIVLFYYFLQGKPQLHSTPLLTNPSQGLVVGQTSLGFYGSVLIYGIRQHRWAGGCPQPYHHTSLFCHKGTTINATVYSGQNICNT